MVTNRTGKRWGRPLLFTTFIILVAFTSFIALRVVLGFGITFHGSFQQVQPGMSEARVVALLGAPDEKSAEFRLGQYHGFEREFARAAQSGSAYYLRWHKGIDVVYTVGFDEQGQVTTKAFGGT